MPVTIYVVAASPPPVHLAAVANLRDEDDVLVVVDLVEDSVVTDTDAILVFGAHFQLLAARRAGVVGKRVDRSTDPARDGAGKLPEVARGGWQKADAVLPRLHVPSLG